MLVLKVAGACITLFQKTNIVRFLSSQTFPSWIALGRIHRIEWCSKYLCNNWIETRAKLSEWERTCANKIKSIPELQNCQNIKLDANKTVCSSLAINSCYTCTAGVAPLVKTNANNVLEPSTGNNQKRAILSSRDERSFKGIQAWGSVTRVVFEKVTLIAGANGLLGGVMSIYNYIYMYCLSV